MQYVPREQDPGPASSPGSTPRGPAAGAPYARRIDCAEGAEPRRGPQGTTPRTGRRRADDWTRARRTLD
jgi:hypothetical protein